MYFQALKGTLDLESGVHILSVPFLGEGKLPSARGPIV